MQTTDFAFPIRIDNGADEPTNHPGLTKLEYMATHIAAGLTAAPKTGALNIPTEAVRLAKELIAELEKN